MFTSNSVCFSGTVDSKGRVTVPAEIRERIGLEQGDEVSLSVETGEVIREDISSRSEALERISELAGVRSFSYDGEVLEVYLR